MPIQPKDIKKPREEANDINKDTSKGIKDEMSSQGGGVKLPKAIIRGFDEESICEADKMTKKQRKRRRKRKYDLRTTFDPFEPNVKALEKLQEKYKEEERIKEESERDSQKNVETQNDKDTENKTNKDSENKNCKDDENEKVSNNDIKKENEDEDESEDENETVKKETNKKGNKNNNMSKNGPITDFKLDKEKRLESIMDQKPERHKDNGTPKEKENTTKDKHILFENDPTFTEEVKININEDKPILCTNDKSLLDFANSGNDHIKNADNNKTCNVNIVDLSKNEMVNISLLKYNDVKKVEEQKEPENESKKVVKRNPAEENRDAIKKFYKGIAIHNYQSMVNIKYIEDDGKGEKKTNGLKAFFLKMFGMSSKSD